MTNPNTSKIGLLDNACHSLQRGYEMFNKGKQKQDPLALKEAIIWIHHGIELSIKQLLVQSNEYLIFDNIDKAVEKLVQLRRKTDMSNANVLDLFDYNESVYTVGFGKLIDRAAIMLNLQELAQGTILREKIDALTSYRNKIVHFAVEVKLDEVITLLAELMEPLLSLIEREVKDKEFTANCAPLIRANATPITEIYRAKFQDVEKRIEKLMMNFNGQEVSGRLFGVEGKVKLPKFRKIQRELETPDLGFDLFANNEVENWIVILKISRPKSGHLLVSANQAERFIEKSNLHNAKVWLIVMRTDDVYVKFGGHPNVLFSTEKDIAELERLLENL